VVVKTQTFCITKFIMEICKKDTILNNEPRYSDKISVCPCLWEDFDFGNLRNTEGNSKYEDIIRLVWLDRFQDNDKQENQYSINLLRRIFDSVTTFSNEVECLEFIDQFKTENKLFVIVSGSFGENFVPKINQLPQINSIYVYCRLKSKHESWARRHNKIKGVFTDIHELCVSLKSDKQKCKQDQTSQNTKDLLSKDPSFFCHFEKSINFNDSKYDDRQPKDDTKRIIKSAVIPFSVEESYLPIRELERSDKQHASKTVTPFTEYKQQMAFSDTGRIKKS
jgi:hypothetical protein